MNVHFFQHVPFEAGALVEKWASSNGHNITYTRFYEPEFSFPELDEIDFLVILGGPMNIYEYSDYSWLVKEKAFIKSVIEHGIKTLGICLGAQLIADCLGVKVYPNSYKEIGWYEIVKLSNRNKLDCALPEKLTAFHWHGDTFDIPEGAVHLYSTNVCTNQAFLYGDNVLALQFHIEYTRESVEQMLINCSEELTFIPYVQQRDQITSCYSNLVHTSEVLNKLLDEFMGI